MAARACLVAGGTGALGGAVVRELLDAGRPVTVTWVVDEERERAERELGEHEGLSFVEANLLEPEGAERAVESVAELGAVVNLVGGFDAPGKVHETELDGFERMLRLNLVPGFLLARAAMPRLVDAGGGAYVGVGARAALVPFAGAAGYITGKAGVIAFVRALDREYGPAGVRANAVLPSTIDTPANRRAQPDADTSSWVPPAQIARVVRFLVSDDAAAVTGAAVPVYG